MGGHYLLYHLGDMRLFAVPERPRLLRRAALGRFQPFSFNRWLYRLVVGYSMPFGVDRLLARRVDLSDPAEAGLDFVRWVEEVRDQLEEPDLRAALFWPKQSDRGRVYAHLFSPELVPLGFAKISLDDANDRWLADEAAALDDLERIDLAPCRVPSVLFGGGFAGHRYLVFDPLPITATPLADRDRLDCLPALAGPARHVASDAIPELSWWSSYRARLTVASGAFDNELRRRLSRGLEVCRAHGDIAPANLFLDGTTLWIIDWEESRADAPSRTDELGFEMAIRGIANAPDARTRSERFRKLWGANASDASRTEVMAVLAFRHAMGHKDAACIIENWTAHS